MTEDVAVVGLGIHAFGRHPGVSGLEMGAHAVRAALADAGIGWEQVDFAAGGSDSAGNADTMVSVVGLTGVPFINVKNGCATGGSALTTAHAMLSAGSADIALVVGFDKHPPGAFNPLPEEWGIGSWYGETGLMLTTQFFGMKIQRYMGEHGISESTLAKVAAKAFENGSRNPNAWRRQPLSEQEVLASRMVSDPLRQYMFCSPGEGAVALVLARGSRIRELTSKPVLLRSVAFRTRRFGSFEVFSPSIPIESAPSPTAEAAAAAFEQAGIGPGRRRRGAAPGHRVGRRDHASRRDRSLSARGAGIADPGRRHADRRASSGQHGRRLPGVRRADRGVRPAAGA